MKTPEERYEIIKAMLESKFEPQEFVTQIRLMLADYFVGKFEQAGNKITINFYNGQKFEVIINEV